MFIIEFLLLIFGMFQPFQESELCLQIPEQGSPEYFKGLSGIESLENGKGMLFENNNAIWMKDMEIPLNFYFVNEKFEVLEKMTAYPCTKEPCEIYKVKEANHVIETNISAEFKIGEKIKWRECK